MFRNPLEEQGGEGRGLFAPRALRLSQKKKKSSLRELRAHKERTYISCTSCAGTRGVPFLGCSSMGDRSGGEDGGEERRPKSACPRVLIIAQLIACPMRSFPSSLEKSV